VAVGRKQQASVYVSPTGAEIEIEVLFDGEMVETQVVPARGVGQFTPYYPLVFTPEQAGTYRANADFSETGVDFAVVERSETPIFQVGETLPPFKTPTVDDDAGVTPICSRTEPCGFHDISLDDALASGKPTAMLIATPAWCQTDVCGANVEWLIELGADRDDINIIHAEVYEDFANAGNGLPKRAPMLEAWDIAFEPSLFVVDAGGIITDARHFAFDREEIAELLASV